MKLWINENDFVEVAAAAMRPEPEEIITRQRYDGVNDMDVLPDPDPVLKAAGKDISTYRQMKSDAHVWSCISSRKSGTMPRDWDITEAARGGSAAANVKAAELVKDVFSSLPMRNIMSDMLDAALYGISPMEVIWQADGNEWRPTAITGKPPEWFLFDQANRIRFKTQNNQDGEELPPYKILLCRHHADYLNPYGERLLSKCFWPVAFKKGGFKFWAIFTEKYGMPWVIGNVPRGTGQPERNAFLSRLVSMVQDAVAVINNDEKIDIKESAFKASSAGIYEKLISVSNREISKAILNQTLSTEVQGGGSYAATKGHLEVREDVVNNDSAMVTEAFNTLCAWITDLNVPAAAPPVFAFEEKEDLQNDRAERDDKLSKNITFTPAYYMRTYNLEEDDFEMRSGQPVIAAEFAEKTATPDAADILADRLDKEAAGIIDGYTDKIRALVNSASSFAEIRDGLIDLDPEMNSSDLGALMQKAMTAAELAGRSEVMDEIK